MSAANAAILKKIYGLGRPSDLASRTTVLRNGRKEVLRNGRYNENS